MVTTRPARDSGSTTKPGRSATPPPAPAVIIGGMPGWQIALIAIAAAVVAAAAAVILDRARTAHRHQLAPSA